MPSFVLSLALLLLVVLTLLAVSNRALIALTFLGITTVALPLAVWMAGAIALGFLLGLWILLLFRFGTVAAAGSGSPLGGQRRSHYGPEDFAVVDESSGAGRYEEGRYEEGRYDDVYSRGTDGRDRQTDRDGREIYGYDSDAAGDNMPRRGAREYAAEGYAAGDYGPGDYVAGDYAPEAYSAGQDDADRTAADPQDRFAATEGFGAAEPRDRTGQAGGFTPENWSDRDTSANPNGASNPNRAVQEITEQRAGPEDWDDPYREDWTQEELMAEPVLRNGADQAPRLKRWLSPSWEERPKLNLGGFGASGEGRWGNHASDGDRQDPAAAQGTGLPQNVRPEDWPRDDGDRSPRPRSNPRDGANDSSPQAQADRRDVYDADYRVIRKPDDPASQQGTGAGASANQEAQTGRAARSQRRDRPSRDEWDIDEDLNW